MQLMSSLHDEVQLVQEGIVSFVFYREDMTEQLRPANLGNGGTWQMLMVLWKAAVHPALGIGFCAGRAICKQTQKVQV